MYGSDRDSCLRAVFRLHRPINEWSQLCLDHNSGSTRKVARSTHQSDSQTSDDGAALLRRASDAAAQAAVRLDKRTHLDEGHYRVVLRHYGEGLAEIGWSFVPSSAMPKAARGKSRAAFENRDRASRRARSRLRHLILASRADHLLTLTYRANVIDADKACVDLAKFVRIVKGRKPEWIYIAVAEQQARGAWHWHLAVCGRQDVQLLRASWRHVVGDGNIDVAAPRGSGHSRTLSLVRYLGKYLSKGFSEPQVLNARRFRSSLGIQVPAQYLRVPEEDRADPYVFAVSELARVGGSIGHIWRSADRTAGWACSWK